MDLIPPLLQNGAFTQFLLEYLITLLNRVAYVRDAGIQNGGSRQRWQQSTLIAQARKLHGVKLVGKMSELSQQSQMLVKILAPRNFPLDWNSPSGISGFLVARMKTAVCIKPSITPVPATRTSPSITDTREPFMPLFTENTVPVTGHFHVVGHHSRDARSSFSRLNNDACRGPD